MGLTRKEMHLFQPWKTLKRSMQLFSAYKRLPPIRCLHPNHGSCSNHRQVYLEDRCVPSLPCIQHSLFQILSHVFEPPILCKVEMNSSLLAYSLSKGIMPRWYQEMALPQGNVIVEAPYTTTAELGGPSSHMQPMHETILARDSSTPPLQVVPPTVPSHATTRSKSKNAPQSSLGPVAPFVANLRSQALPRQSTASVGLRRPMLFRDIEGAPTNNTDNSNERPPPICALRRARRPREDGPRRDVTKKTKRIKSATGPTQDKIKIKKLVEYGCAGRDSDDNDVELSGENDDTSHAEALSNSTYCEGD
jgi:hypothetical protein